MAHKMQMYHTIVYIKITIIINSYYTIITSYIIIMVFTFFIILYYIN